MRCLVHSPYHAHVGAGARALVLRRAMLLALFAFSANSSACVPYERAKIDANARFELLYQRDLSAFEQRLAAENQTDVDDDWTRVGEAWVALANCQKIDANAFASDPENPGADRSGDALARFIHTSLRLEEARRERLIFHRGTGFRKSSLRGSMFAALDDEDFFIREPSGLPEDHIQWPAAEEAWVDELPGAIAQPNQCQDMYRALFSSARKERAAYNKREEKLRIKRGMNPLQLLEPLPPRMRLRLTPELLDDPASRTPDTLADYEANEVDLLEQIAAQYDALPEDARRIPSIEALAWRARFHQACLYSDLVTDLTRLRKLSITEAEIARTWDERRALLFEELAAPELDGDPDLPAIEPMLRSQALLFYASKLDADGALARSTRAYERAFEIGVDQLNFWNARYSYLRALSKSARWEDALELKEPLPPLDSPVYGAYVYRIGHALHKTGQTDAFMAHALATFRDKPYKADPFTRALYVRMLNILAEYPFDTRIIELLEDMGPRSTIFGRVDEYTAVSLDRGQAANAAAASRWLLAKHLNANYHPKYWANLALSAFLEDDLKSFEKYLERVVERPPELVEALGYNRRATFFASADAQLARVFREMLPVMAEWGDAPKAQALRKKWLEVIVKTSQDFVRQTPGSLARPALIELYRIASSLLEASDPRAYPERVGQDKPAPLVLGTVRVTDRDLDPYEPTYLIQFGWSFSLTLVPRDMAPMGKWEPWWIEIPTSPVLEPMLPREDDKKDRLEVKGSTAEEEST